MQGLIGTFNTKPSPRDSVRKQPHRVVNILVSAWKRGSFGSLSLVVAGFVGVGLESLTPFAAGWGTEYQAVATGGETQDPEQSPPTTDSANKTAEATESLPKPVRRARRPQFTSREWSGTYFDDWFAQALVGAPPDFNQIGPAPRAGTPAAAGSVAGKRVPTGTPGADGTNSNSPDGASAESAVAGWETLLPADILETEIKRLQNGLDTQITTPIKFKTDYLAVRDSFDLLSMWMAIIQRYSGTVRWQSDAETAQRFFARTAANCRVASDQAYNGAVAARDALRELVRGGGLGVTVETEEFSWPRVVDRNAIMRRLETGLAAMKQRTGSREAFQQEIEEFAHDAALIAAMGRVLAEPEMDGSEEEDYVAYARVMMAAAQEARQAVELNNYELASAALNKIDTSCNDCHADWR